ncbi:energy-coupling factor ABC transporter substrate-binding protein [Brevibacillus sp. MCWH]|uniref:energy-coupling factor ABC transporter substrate-binding protein n=1 Tax=Brevibacillus sp. MCWH TaxID=2508871 RepID=UPI000E363ED2|nr:energy-coupling factor ABC transporter substrate-binding protein [Brevibacillus sp. MCWH]REK63757.1 MAG: energy-coupling factor ABC transporter substrate-binding protein [Brevibacillus sp.]
MKRWSNWVLLLLVALLAVLPLILVKDSEFGGADGAAEEAIKVVAPDYEPWFQPLVEPPGGETESLLFAVQAALGAGFIGYAIGLYRGRLNNGKEQ